MSLHSRNKQRGITIIEVVVAMVIFSVGILGMSSLQLRVLQATQDQHQRDAAIWKAQALMERIRLNTSLAALTRYEADINNDDFCENDPVVVCVDTYDTVADAHVNAAVCNATNMAIYDSWEIICDAGGTQDKLTNIEIELKCGNDPYLPCAPDLNIELTLTWESHASRGDPRLTGNTTIVQGNDGEAQSVAANKERYRQVFLP